MMNDELIKLIDAEKEILSTLPKNNIRNKKKYVETLDKDISDYSDTFDKVKKEVLKRKQVICDKITENNDLDVLLEKVSLIKKELYLFNDYNSAYEKMGFDKILYNLVIDDTKTLEDVNEDIYACVLKFKEAGIELKDVNFKYSPIAYEYMKEFFKYIKNLKDSSLKNKFEELYWQFPDIIMHIETTFKNLYYKNIKVFDKYLISLKNKVISDNKKDIFELYKEEKEKYDLVNRNNMFEIFNKFKNRELNPDDYSRVKIDQLLNTFIEVDNIDEKTYQDIIVNLSKLYNTTIEYQKYLKYNYILENMRKIYAEKEKYKDVVKIKIKEINKEEKKLLRLVKKFYPLKLKNKKPDLIDKLNMDINNQMKVIKGLYESLEEDKFNECVKSLNDNSEISSMLGIANSYYIYQYKCLKEVNEESSFNDVSNNIIDLGDLLCSPYNNLINNINIGDDKDIKIIISERYKLANINISVDQLEDEGNLENIQNNIEKIFIFDNISKCPVELGDIEYVYKVSNLIKTDDN